MNISIAGFSVHGLLASGCIDIFGYLESCRYRFNLDTADLWNGMLGGIEPDRVKLIKHAVDERDLTVVNYHADGVHVWDDDDSVREANYRGAMLHLETAAALGAKTVRIDTGGKVERISSRQLEVVAKTYRKYCEFGARHGFKVGPENHWGLSLLQSNMLDIAAAVNHPSYGILLHIGHWEQGDPVEGDQALAHLAVHTHVDARIARDCLLERMSLLTENGYTGCWGVEHHSAHNEYVEIGYQLAAVRRACTQLNIGRNSVPYGGNPLLTAEQERRVGA